MIKAFLGFWILVLPLAAIEADAKRGADLFLENRCTTCHSISGVGGKLGPDLSQRLDREYTPAGIVSQLWNHAPKMWAAMREARVDLPKLTEANSADLFAFFYSTRYFERRGDAARGKRVFMEKNCVVCHVARGSAKPAKEWKSLGDPVELVGAMWNHAPEMNKANQGKDYKWPQMTSDELTDLLVYIQNLPETRSLALHFSLPNGDKGKQLLESRGCVNCHKGNMALEGRLGSRTLTDVAASMWNHAPKMREQAKELTADEVREILAYAWAQQFFQPKGNTAKGGKLFAAQCGSCHNDRSSGAPDLMAKKGTFNSVTMLSALWRHGPQMIEKMENQHKVWPVLNAADMGNLISFLGSR